mgnify:CR=1 FL=1
MCVCMLHYQIAGVIPLPVNTLPVEVCMGHWLVGTSHGVNPQRHGDVVWWSEGETYEGSLTMESLLDGGNEMAHCHGS